MQVALVILADCLAVKANLDTEDHIVAVQAILVDVEDTVS
jgi:hypothetical protein